MTITINTTPAQDIALNNQNLKSNPVNPPPINAFAVAMLTDTLNALITNQSVDASRPKLSALVARADQLTQADLTTLQTIIDSHPITVLPPQL